MTPQVPSWSLFGKYPALELSPRPVSGIGKGQQGTDIGAGKYGLQWPADAPAPSFEFLDELQILGGHVAVILKIVHAFEIEPIVPEQERCRSVGPPGKEEQVSGQDEKSHQAEHQDNP